MSLMDELQIGAGTPDIFPLPGDKAEPGKKMSDKVLIRRFPDQHTVIGPPVIIKGIDEASELLAQNAWMRLWVAEKIKQALLSGEIFSYFRRMDVDWRGRPDGLVAEYRRASEEEVLNFVDTEQFVTSTGHAISRRAQETGYILHYHEGSVLIEAYDSLPRQAKVILDVLNETGRENFTEASIEVVLSDKADLLKTKQPPMKIFMYYRKRLVDDGHLEEVES